MQIPIYKLILTRSADIKDAVSHKAQKAKAESIHAAHPSVNKSYFNLQSSPTSLFLFQIDFPLKLDL